MEIYGKELILDISGCNISTFTREGLSQYFEELCDLIQMERCDLHFWDYDTKEERDAQPAHLAGISAIQFIKTSNITVHTLDKYQSVLLNIFSCKEFKAQDVIDFSLAFFGGRVVSTTEANRYYAV